MGSPRVGSSFLISDILHGKSEAKEGVRRDLKRELEISTEGAGLGSSGGSESERWVGGGRRRSAKTGGHH